MADEVLKCSAKNCEQVAEYTTPALLCLWHWTWWYSNERVVVDDPHARAAATLGVVLEEIRAEVRADALKAREEELAATEERLADARRRIGALQAWAKRAEDEIQLLVDGEGHDEHGNPMCMSCGNELPERNADLEGHEPDCEVERRCRILHDLDAIRNAERESERASLSAALSERDLTERFNSAAAATEEANPPKED